MKAVTWQAARKVATETVPDPSIVEPTDVIIRVTSTGICGSDLHLLDTFVPFMNRGDIIGHEPMGVVEDVGGDVRNLRAGDRVVIPFVIACGECAMCRLGLTTQCETTQNRESGLGASLYGYTKLYGGIAGGQAEFLRVPLADFNARKVGDELDDERYLFLGDILPTAWQGVEYANVPEGGTLGVLGLGPVGQLATRIGGYRGYRVFAADPVPERRALAERHGVQTFDLTDDLLDRLRESTDGRGPDGVIDAVGMEAHGNPVAAFAQNAVAILPDPMGEKLAKKAGVDRLAALLLAFDAVRRGGTVSITGVYAGAADPLPMMILFDKGLSLRTGECNVHRWLDDLVPLVEDPADPLGVTDLVTHRGGLDDAADLYEAFKTESDGCVKVVLRP
ncbi:MAG TPA: alcohol dehydrogenase catalytic domain-containing protein [Microbacteriaceae bacterium]|jgi:threonine dehydrogenase-like Zn-dependent dehydrogenase|nr:alcohol dehydrogenase catalytic domain-containing protein [Microbacteriaceae bacterium]